MLPMRSTGGGVVTEAMLYAFDLLESDSEDVRSHHLPSARPGWRSWRGAATGVTGGRKLNDFPCDKIAHPIPRFAGEINQAAGCIECHTQSANIPGLVSPNMRPEEWHRSLVAGGPATSTHVALYDRSAAK